MARIVIVPGLAVRSYAKPAALALERHGHRVSLLAAPAWRGTPTDPVRYGQRLAEQLEQRDEHVDLLVGLSIGTQAAAHAASLSDRVGHLLLISPTFDPLYRSPARLMRRWTAGDPDDEGKGWVGSLPDWLRAGPIRIFTGAAWGLARPLENVLPRIRGPITLVHNEHDSLSTEGWVRELAEVSGGRFVAIEHAPHSWPIDREDDFVVFVDELLAARAG